MKLEDIGFYTLKDSRAEHTSMYSPLWRCEMILTSDCNFDCVYCRKFEMKHYPMEKALKTIQLWTDQGLKNIRFSGGEPTLYPDLRKLVWFAREEGVERIAISTNGSASLDTYLDLIAVGVNDFSISLDSCCVGENDKMSGTNNEMWEHITYIIKALSLVTYVTIGIVINEENIDSVAKTIIFCDELGVDDIRIIPSAQYSKILPVLKQVPDENMLDHPILNYRINNSCQGRSVRGLQYSDSHQCSLVLDDMVALNDKHYPCIIYLREGGEAIGRIGKNMRRDREDWGYYIDTHKDPICKANCLDVCIDYNNKVRDFEIEDIPF